jgi:hypothetical protein
MAGHDKLLRMRDEDLADGKRDKLRKSKTVRITFYVLFLLFLGGALSLLFLHSRGPNHNDGEELKQLLPAVNYTIYYPTEDLSYNLLPNSVSYQRGIVSYIYKYGKDTINITEQPKPPVIEQVTKTDKFSTTIGQAYLADLNGKTAGFIDADKTLVILTSSSNNSDKLRKIMENFQKLN